MSRSMIARSYGSSYMLVICFNCQIVSQGGCAMLSIKGMLLNCKHSIVFPLPGYEWPSFPVSSLVADVTTFFIFAILVRIEDILLAFEHRGFLGSSNGKQSACNAGDLGSISGLGRSPGEGHGNPLQYSCLENSMNRRAWRATVRGVTKSWTWLSN